MINTVTMISRIGNYSTPLESIAEQLQLHNEWATANRHHLSNLNRQYNGFTHTISMQPSVFNAV